MLASVSSVVRGAMLQSHTVAPTSPPPCQGTQARRNMAPAGGHRWSGPSVLQARCSKPASRSRSGVSWLAPVAGSALTTCAETAPCPCSPLPTQARKRMTRVRTVLRG